MKFLFGFFLLGILTSCSEPIVTDYTIEVEANQVSSSVIFAPLFSLDLAGSYDIVVSEVNYGSIDFNGVPLQLGLTSSLAMFTSDAWTGFEPVSTLPNGENLPDWITTDLVYVDIPSLNPNFELRVYAGYETPYYMGSAIDLNFLDDIFPDGLSLSQVVLKDGKILGEFLAYGPSKDDSGNILSHGGLFTVFTFQPGEQKFSLVNPRVEIKTVFRGKNAHLYENNPKKQKELLRKIKKALKANPLR